MGKRELKGSKRKAAKSEARSKSARHRSSPAKQNATPTWPVVGSIVDYCAIIGAPPTERALVVRSGPEQMGIGEWCVWLEGKPSAVSVLACRPAEADDSSAEVKIEIRSADLEIDRVDLDRRVGELWGWYLHADGGDLPVTDPDLDAAGWLHREIVTHEGRSVRDAGAWDWDITRPVVGQYEDQQIASAIRPTNGDDLPSVSRGHDGSQCEGCRLPIREGEDVLRYDDALVTHAHCPDGLHPTHECVAEQTRHDVAASVARHARFDGFDPSPNNGVLDRLRTGRVPYAEDQMELPVVSAPVLPPLTPEEDRAEDAMATADCALMAGFDASAVDLELIDKCGLVRFDVITGHVDGCEPGFYLSCPKCDTDESPPMSAAQYEAARLAEPDCRDEDGAP